MRIVLFAPQRRHQIHAVDAAFPRDGSEGEKGRLEVFEAGGPIAALALLESQRGRTGNDERDKHFNSFWYSVRPRCCEALFAWRRQKLPCCRA